MEVYKRNIGWQHFQQNVCNLAIKVHWNYPTYCDNYCLSKVHLIAYSFILTKLGEANNRSGKGVVKFRISILFRYILCVFGTSVVSMFKSAVVKLYDCRLLPYWTFMTIFIYILLRNLKQKWWIYVCCSSSQAKNTCIVLRPGSVSIFRWRVGKRGEPTLVEPLDNGKCQKFQSPLWPHIIIKSFKVK